MNISRLVLLVTVLVPTFSSHAAAAQQDPTVASSAVENPPTITTITVSMKAVPPPKRPAALPALYASLGATQVWDLYSTAQALNRGAREANPAAAAFTGNSARSIGLKVATTTSTIYFAERVWRKNKATAIVMMIGVNGAAAAVAIQNTRNAAHGGTR